MNEQQYNDPRVRAINLIDEAFCGLYDAVSKNDREKIKASFQGFKNTVSGSATVFTGDLKSEHQQAVEAFMRKAGQIVQDHPVVRIPDQECILSAKMLFEECWETILKGLGVVMRVYNTEGHPSSIQITKNNVNFFVASSQNVVEVIDGTSDVHVIATGIAARYGVIEAPVLSIVDANNLEKFGPGSSIRADGKLIKPPGHKPPDIAGELKRQSEAWQEKQEKEVVRE